MNRHFFPRISVIANLMLAAGMVLSCDKSPERDALRNLWKNNPWKLVSLEARAFSDENTPDSFWDTTVYNYAVLTFLKDKDIYTNTHDSSGEITRNGETKPFTYSIGSVNGNTLVTIRIDTFGYDTFTSTPSLGKEMTWENFSRKYIGPNWLLPFLPQTAHYSFVWRVVSEK